LICYFFDSCGSAFCHASAGDRLQTQLKQGPSAAERDAKAAAALEKERLSHYTSRVRPQPNPAKASRLELTAVQSLKLLPQGFAAFDMLRVHRYAGHRANLHALRLVKVPTHSVHLLGSIS
jgi:hypothetical protein